MRSNTYIEYLFATFVSRLIGRRNSQFSFNGHNTRISLTKRIIYTHLSFGQQQQHGYQQNNNIVADDGLRNQTH